jgi:uncharacterized protein YuzE
MKISYDPETDAMFAWFGPESQVSARTEEVASGIMLDFDEHGHVIGIEVLNVRERMKGSRAAA